MINVPTFFSKQKTPNLAKYCLWYLSPLQNFSFFKLFHVLPSTYTLRNLFISTKKSLSRLKTTKVADQFLNNTNNLPSLNHLTTLFLYISKKKKKINHQAFSSSLKWHSQCPMFTQKPKDLK